MIMEVIGDSNILILIFAFGCPGFMRDMDILNVSSHFSLMLIEIVGNPLEYHT